MAMNLRIFMPGNPSEGHKRSSQALVRDLPEALPYGAHPFPLDDEAPARALAPAAALFLRAFDLGMALLLLVLLALPLMIIALIVKLDSPGPVLFKQLRVGKDGQEFWFYKFRSMVADAEARRAALMQMNEASGPLFKIKNDPRITRSGRWLRKLSLDELPQLLNVVKGEMSLVGPRPALPVEVAQYSSRQRRRLAVKPGITGLWQVSGRSDLPFDRSIELDLEYVDRQSLWLYVKILWLTFPAVLQGRGAY
ncbi:MAG TPA: sugar transferase [Capsulimonadaceae bacterium]|nr:sugar transferase [Capsulimonadaceae bacterium]